MRSRDPPNEASITHHPHAKPGKGQFVCRDIVQQGDLKKPIRCCAQGAVILGQDLQEMEPSQDRGVNHQAGKYLADMRLVLPAEGCPGLMEKLGMGKPIVRLAQVPVSMRQAVALGAGVPGHSATTRKSSATWQNTGSEIHVSWTWSMASGGFGREALAVRPGRPPATGQKINLIWTNARLNAADLQVGLDRRNRLTLPDNARGLQPER